MPTYTYKCTDCKHRFEITRSYSDSATEAPECKHCGSKQTRRVITNTFAISGGAQELPMAGGHSHSHSHSCGSCGGGDCGHCGH
jgi:putative FmdB family regulatory protein